MGRITRQLKTTSGAIVGFIVIAILAFFVLNLIQTKGPGPIAGIGGWLFQRASGEAYSGGGSAMTANSNPATSSYSLSNNLGPAL